MKTPKPQKNLKAQPIEKTDKVRTKKKMEPQTSKVNVKSNKFWNEHYDIEDEDLEIYMDKL